jgi:hypothetical protein
LEVDRLVVRPRCDENGVAGHGRVDCGLDRRMVLWNVQHRRGGRSRWEKRGRGRWEQNEKRRSRDGNTAVQ